MSAEKIIEKIRKDTEKEVHSIITDAEKQADVTITTAKKDAEQEAKHILARGKTQSENIKKILLSKAGQDAKKEQLQIKETIIEDCFHQAMKHLAQLQGEHYTTFILNLLKTSKKHLGENQRILVSRDSDRVIAQQEGVIVEGTVNASGGIILKSADGKISIDYTFEGIMKRKKDDIRIHIGKQLFT
ncbi:MAG: V-type ATP synthase subunit E family protein [Methanobacteriota archaeon]